MNKCCYGNEDCPICPKEEVGEKCYSCGGKGTYSQIHGEEGFEDFGGERYVKAPSIHNYPCKMCNGTGLKSTPPLEVGEKIEYLSTNGDLYSATNNKTYKRVGDNWEEVSTPPLEVKEGSKDIEWDNWEVEFEKKHWGAMFECGDYDALIDDIRSLLSQQEAKIKREFMEMVEGIKETGESEKCRYDMPHPRAYNKALDDIKKLLSE